MTSRALIDPSLHMDENLDRILDRVGRTRGAVGESKGEPARARELDGFL